MQIQRDTYRHLFSGFLKDEHLHDRSKAISSCSMHTPWHCQCGNHGSEPMQDFHHDLNPWYEQVLSNICQVGSHILVHLILLVGSMWTGKADAWYKVIWCLVHNDQDCGEAMLWLKTKKADQRRLNTQAWPLPPTQTAESPSNCAVCAKEQDTLNLWVSCIDTKEP
jgi:hypothetical protein